MKRYLSAAEAAQYIGLSPSFLAKLRCSGGGPAYIKAGRVLYDRDDLDAWMAARKLRSTSEKPLNSRKP